MGVCVGVVVVMVWMSEVVCCCELCVLCVCVCCVCLCVVVVCLCVCCVCVCCVLSVCVCVWCVCVCCRCVCVCVLWVCVCVLSVCVCVCCRCVFVCCRGVILSPTIQSERAYSVTFCHMNISLCVTCLDLSSHITVLRATHILVFLSPSIAQFAHDSIRAYCSARL